MPAHIKKINRWGVGGSQPQSGKYPDFFNEPFPKLKFKTDYHYDLDKL